TSLPGSARNRGARTTPIVPATRRSAQEPSRRGAAAPRSPRRARAKTKPPAQWVLRTRSAADRDARNIRSMPASRLVAAMCLGQVGSLLPHMAFSALIPRFADVWGLSASESGMIAGAFFVGYALVVP